MLPAQHQIGLFHLLCLFTFKEEENYTAPSPAFPSTPYGLLQVTGWWFPLHPSAEGHLKAGSFVPVMLWVL